MSSVNLMEPLQGKEIKAKTAVSLLPYSFRKVSSCGCALERPCPCLSFQL